jgi:hypothetical protein
MTGWGEFHKGEKGRRSSIKIETGHKYETEMFSLLLSHLSSLATTLSVFKKAPGSLKKKLTLHAVRGRPGEHSARGTSTDQRCFVYISDENPIALGWFPSQDGFEIYEVTTIYYINT